MPGGAHYALNNRADLLEKRGDSAGSVADRTSVLNLDDTSYDRRYIAYSRARFQVK